MYTPSEAIEAIKARQNGDYKNVQLLKLGPLSATVMEDIERIVANTTEEPKTKVLFLKEVFPEGILAVFPEQTEKDFHYCCYSRKGQHSTASKGYAMMLKQAKSKDYTPLLKELTQQGYNLELLNGTGYKL